MTDNDSIDNDSQFEDYIIHAVKPHGEHSFTLDLRDGGTLWVENDKGLIRPFPGWTARLYGKGFGFPVRGVVVGDLVYRYETEDQYQASMTAAREEDDARKREEWKANLAENQARVDALPVVFRERFNGFIQARTDFGWQFGPYELMVCEQAAQLATALSDDPDAISKFQDLSNDEKLARFPNLDQGHSDNSFSAMVVLAITYLLNPKLVPKMHGVLCPLVGCEDYGCFAARPEAS